MGTLNDLPTDLLILIFGFLPCGDLINCSEVCKLWNKQAAYDPLWKNLVLRKSVRSGVSFNKTNNEQSWRDYFKEIVKLPSFPSDRERLRSAFSALRTLGYEARMSHTCCTTCGWTELKSDGKKVVFWHLQSDDAFDDSKNLKYTLWLQWSGDQKLIVDVLRSRGLDVTETPDGTASKCIAVNSSAPITLSYFKYKGDEEVSDGEYHEPTPALKKRTKKSKKKTGKKSRK